MSDKLPHSLYNIDHQWLLVQSNASINNTPGKQYTHQSYTGILHDYDKTILCYHKKQIKQIQRKDLGQKMIIYQFVDNLPHCNLLAWNAYLTALSLFSWFDEETWKKYCYLPHISPQQANTYQHILTKIWYDTKATIDTYKHFVIAEIHDWHTSIPTLEWALEWNDETIISLLRWLVLVYGKRSMQWETLMWCTITVPLPGTAFWLVETFWKLVDTLHKMSIVVHASIPEESDNDFILTIHDAQILEQFAKAYAPLATITKIAKTDLTDYHRSLLIDYLKNQWGSDNLIDIISTKKLNLLPKN